MVSSPLLSPPTHPSTHPPTGPSIRLSTHLFIHPPTHLSILPYTCPFIHPSVHPSTHPFTHYLSIHLSIHVSSASVSIQTPVLPVCVSVICLSSPLPIQSPLTRPPPPSHLLTVPVHAASRSSARLFSIHSFISNIFLISLPSLSPPSLLPSVLPSFYPLIHPAICPSICSFTHSFAQSLTHPSFHSFSHPPTHPPTFSCWHTPQQIAGDEGVLFISYFGSKVQVQEQIQWGLLRCREGPHEPVFP